MAQDEEVEDNFGNGFCAPTQRQLWNLFENPHHSKAAKVPIQICNKKGLKGISSSQYEVAFISTMSNVGCAAICISVTV